MRGCSSDPAVRASRRNRSTASALVSAPDSSVLSAILRWSCVSNARYTTPMPPRPSSLRISYLPNLRRGSGVLEGTSSTRAAPGGRSCVVASSSADSRRSSGRASRVGVGGPRRSSIGRASTVDSTAPATASNSRRRSSAAWSSRIRPSRSRSDAKPWPASSGLQPRRAASTCAEVSQPRSTTSRAVRSAGVPDMRIHLRSRGKRT